MRKSICLILILCFINFLIKAQETSNNEPGNNLGHSISQLRSKFPNLRYISTTSGKDFYVDGNISFELKNNQVITEYMLIDGDDGYPLMWYRATATSFLKTNFKTYIKGESFYTFVYTTFNITIYYTANDNTASITYESTDKNLISSSTEIKSIDKENTFYGSEVDVYGSSPIYGLPDSNSNLVCVAKNGKVKLLSKINANFYLVEYNGKKGYLSTTWIKK